jgi:hypothetical protein
MSIHKPSIKEQKILNGWRSDARMRYLANPGRDLTAKEQKEWERGMESYLLRFSPTSVTEVSATK